MKGLLRFLAAILCLVIIIALALVVFDISLHAKNADTAANNPILMSIRNLFPETWLNDYDGWRAQMLRWLRRVFSEPPGAASYGAEYAIAL